MTVGRSRILVGLLLVLVGLVGVVLALPAAAAPALTVAEVAGPMARDAAATATSPTAGADTAIAVSFEGTGLVDRRWWADVDGDGVPDVVEDALCGLGTCANPWDDVDGDGIADWVEFLACGDATCADARVDSDGDKIPDFFGLVLCGGRGWCGGALRGEIDGDGVANWFEVVILGDATSAVGDEDFNGNGVPDAVELAKCLEVKPGPDGLASTGVSVWLWLAAGVALIGAGVAATGVARVKAGESK